MKTLLLAALTFAANAAQAIEIPAGFHRETVQLPDFKMNVYKGGSGAPVVLIHGMGESALMWEPAMKALAKDYTVIVPDLRGAGLSKAPEGGYTKVELANDVKTLLDHYGLSKARIVGHDIGLMVAYAFAAKYPEATEKLVVMDAFLPGVGPGDDIYNSPDGDLLLAYEVRSARNLGPDRQRRAEKRQLKACAACTRNSITAARRGSSCRRAPERKI